MYPSRLTTPTSCRMQPAEPMPQAEAVSADLQRRRRRLVVQLILIVLTASTRHILTELACLMSVLGTHMPVLDLASEIIGQAIVLSMGSVTVADMFEAGWLYGTISYRTHPE